MADSHANGSDTTRSRPARTVRHRDESPLASLRAALPVQPQRGLERHKAHASMLVRPGRSRQADAPYDPSLPPLMFFEESPLENALPVSIETPACPLHGLNPLPCIRPWDSAPADSPSSCPHVCLPLP